MKDKGKQSSKQKPGVVKAVRWLKWAADSAVWHMLCDLLSAGAAALSLAFCPSAQGRLEPLPSPN
jgi:hypothetical protein